MKKRVRIFAGMSVVGATAAWLAPMPFDILGWLLVVISAAGIFDVLDEK